jgi:hypothetical protein
MLLLPGSSVRDDKLEASAAQTHGEAFHLCATAHLRVSAVKHIYGQEHRRRVRTECFFFIHEIIKSEQRYVIQKAQLIYLKS